MKEEYVFDDAPGAEGISGDILLCASDIVLGMMQLRSQQFRRYRLTRMEQKVAGAMMDGESLKDIAERLNLSVPAVKYNARNIYKKTNSVNKSDFIRKMRRGMYASKLDWFGVEELRERSQWL